MKYVLLVYLDEGRWGALSLAERASFEEACRAGDHDLRGSLHLIDSADLQNDGALTIRTVNGELSLTEGPTVGSGDRLTSILLIQARDLNAAIHIVSQMPQVQGGPIEVRPVAE
jgi:hypothetical protein